MYLSKLTITMAALLGLGLGLQAANAAPVPDKKPDPQGKRPKLTDIQPAMTPIAYKGKVRIVAFSADGKSLLTVGDDKTVRVWSVATGKETRKIEFNAEVHAATFLGKGGDIVAGCADGVVTLTNADGKMVWQARSFGRSTTSVAVSHDAQQVVTGNESGTLAMFDAASGRATRILRVLRRDTVLSLAFAPDGKKVAGVAKGGDTNVWDVQTGRMLLTIKSESPTSVAISGDGGVLAIAGGKAVTLAELASGKELRKLSAKETFTAVAFSPDGKKVAAVGDDKLARVWATATGKEERVFGDAQGKLAALAFSPDGTLLATAGEKGAIIWDLVKDDKPLPKDLKLTARELAECWNDLAGDDARKAYAAQRLLRADPTRALPFLKERLKPREPGPDEKKIKKLIADLDSDAFKTREAASKELQKLGKAAESALRQAMADGPSAEAQARMKRLLGLLGDNAPLTAEQERDVRAVRVLEQTGSPEAKKLLETLLKESPGWWVTREAKDALERMSGKEK
jgi:Tol biopolymer transport system component